MNHQRVLLLTGMTNDIPLGQHPPNAGNDDDCTYEEVLDATLPSKIRYTKKHGYDLMCLRSFGSPLYEGFKEKNVGFLRAFRAFEMLNHYDVVMWIDADSVITNDSFAIESFGINDVQCVYASYDWPNWAVPTMSFTTGNFIVKSNPGWKELFAAFLHEGRRYTEVYGEELSTMNWLYKHTQFRSFIKILDYKYLQSVPSLLAERRLKMYGDVTNQMCLWNPTYFLCHLTGLPNRDRIKLLNSEFKDYL